MDQPQSPRENLWQELQWRGFIEQCTDSESLCRLLDCEKVTAYIGFDPSADSLHVGNLVPILGLAHLQRHGHRPIAIVGGGTGLVGDPSGKTEARLLLNEEQIARNLQSQKLQLSRFVRFGDGPTDGLMLNNADWLADYNYIEFLREFGRYFSVNRMLTLESVKQRLETGLSFLEFNYMLLQAVDFMVLNRDFGCRLQMGGADQWGNICMGIDLCRRLNRQEVFGLTFPLITTAGGAKMGKTAAGAVWLDAKRTSAYDFYQYWINTDDRDTVRFLRLYTLLPRQEIERLGRLQGAAIREAKAVLAREVTRLVHGDREAAAAEKAAAALFGEGDEEGSIPFSDCNTVDLEGEGIWVVDALVVAGLCPSNSQGRRLIRQQGVRVNGLIVDDEMYRLTVRDARDGRIALQVGKKRHHHIRVV